MSVAPSAPPTIAPSAWFSRQFELFGGSRLWNASEWTSQDDRLRGGISVSYLGATIPDHDNSVTFFGNLDTTTLGGTGFASQRTVDETKRWNLCGFDGLNIVVRGSRADKEGAGSAGTPVLTYTIALKDCIIRGDPDGGREISWEWNFKLSSEKNKQEKKSFYAPFSEFRPHNRGRLLEPVPGKGLDTSQIKRFSLMVRSFFDKQEGPFGLTFVSISAVKLGGKSKGAESVPSCLTTAPACDVEIEAPASDGDGKICPGPSQNASSSRPKGKRNQNIVGDATTGSHYGEDDEYEILDGQTVSEEMRYDNYDGSDRLERPGKEEATGWLGWFYGLFF